MVPSSPYRTHERVAWRLPAPMHAMLDAELLRGERVVWVGVPDARRLGRRALEKVPFALGWNLCIAACVSVSARAGGKVGLLLAPFFVAGLALLAAPFEAVARARRTFYAVTDRRALLFEGEFVRVFDAAVVRRGRVRIERREREAGAGDLLFVWREGRTREETGFYGIADLATVARLVHDVCSGTC
jgi:hypothetical protein